MTFDLTAVLSALAIILNWAVALFGMPHQIAKLYRAKSAEGFSITTFSLYAISFTLALIYGIRIRDSALTIGNIPLVFFSTVILGQIMWYGRKASPAA